MSTNKIPSKIHPFLKCSYIILRNCLIFYLIFLEMFYIYRGTQGFSSKYNLDCKTNSTKFQYFNIVKRRRLFIVSLCL